MITYLSHTCMIQLAKIHNVTVKTSSTVPGQIVINVFNTNLVLKLILFKAPILLDEASVNSLLCNNITLQIRYNLKNMGMDKMTSISASAARSAWVKDHFAIHLKEYTPGIGCTAQTKTSNAIVVIRDHVKASRHSSAQLSTRKSYMDMKNKENNKDKN